MPRQRERLSDPLAASIDGHQTTPPEFTARTPSPQALFLQAPSSDSEREWQEHTGRSTRGAFSPHELSGRQEAGRYTTGNECVLNGVRPGSAATG